MRKLPGYSHPSLLPEVDNEHGCSVSMWRANLSPSFLPHQVSWDPLLLAPTGQERRKKAQGSETWVTHFKKQLPSEDGQHYQSTNMTREPPHPHPVTVSVATSAMRRLFISWVGSLGSVVAKKQRMEQMIFLAPLPVPAMASGEHHSGRLLQGSWPVLGQHLWSKAAILTAKRPGHLVTSTLRLHKQSSRSLTELQEPRLTAGSTSVPQTHSGLLASRTKLHVFL